MSDTAMTPASETLHLTVRAANRIREILARETGKHHFRVYVAGGGCSGFQYGFGLEAQAGEGDVEVQSDGVSVLLDPASLPLLKGSEVDFQESLSGAQFVVNNPNAKASCGCGTSFTV